MLCSCHASTNPAWASLWYASLNLSLYCTKTFSAIYQWVKWFIVSIRLMCLFNPVNVWSCFQNIQFKPIFPPSYWLLLYICISCLFVCVALQSKNVWVHVSLALLICSYLHLNLPLFLLFCLFLPLKVRRDLCRSGQLPSPSDWGSNRSCIQGSQGPIQFISGM